MARYIDADALKLDIDLSKGASVLDMALSVIKAVNEAPTADVIPKAKVEEMLQQIDTLIVEYLDGLYMTGQFLEIFNELKQKYTEALK